MYQEKSLAVIKIGGHAMDDLNLLEAFARDVAELNKKGISFVITHGGGPAINVMLDRLQIESVFVDGLRVTDEKKMDVVEMVLCGQVNKQIVRLMRKAGISSAGISGQDGGLLIASIKDIQLGQVGSIKTVNPAILHTLLGGGFTPVVAPVALGEAGKPLNVNADTAAGAIAGALAADYFILISDVPGVLDADKKLLPALDSAQIAELRDSDVLTGGMIPKVECCQFALREGCKKALILDGRQPNALTRFIEHNERLGTLIGL